MDDRRSFLRTLKNGVLGLGVTVIAASLPLEVLADWNFDHVVLEFVPFSEFNPPACDPFELPPAIYPVVHQGIYPCISRSPIENRSRFLDTLTTDARALGYDALDLLTPHDAVYLAARLTAEKLSYIGEKELTEAREDYARAKKKRDDAHAQLQKACIRLAIAPDNRTSIESVVAHHGMYVAAEQDSLDAIYSHTLARLRAAFETEFAGRGIFYDKAPDVLYNGEKPLVCRQYASVAAAVFETLKPSIPSVSNVVMTTHRTHALAHLWDQASGVYRRGKDIIVQLSFVEPTWLDSPDGETYIDALDEIHMGKNYSLLKKQTEDAAADSGLPVLIRGL